VKNGRSSFRSVLLFSLYRKIAGIPAVVKDFMTQGQVMGDFVELTSPANI
jgi:hypothetical protein